MSYNSKAISASDPQAAEKLTEPTKARPEVAAVFHRFVETLER
jgi:hypothetical protein